MLHRLEKILSACAPMLVILAVAIGVLSLSNPSHKISAAVAGGCDLNGWAWSSTIGWVSFSDETDGSSVNYGVEKGQNGDLDGYAWSSGIGWIKFDSDFSTASIPEGPGTTRSGAKIVGDSVVGWARACAGTAPGDCSSSASRTDGWDGWISFSGNTGSGGAYGWKLNPDNTFNEDTYAWGGDVVGWLVPDNLSCGEPPPTLTFDAEPESDPLPPEGGDVTLTWDSTQTTSCTGENFDTGSPPNMSGSTLVTITQTTTFGVSCVGEDGSTVGPIREIVYVQSPPQCQGPDGDIIPDGGGKDYYKDRRVPVGGICEKQRRECVCATNPETGLRSCTLSGSDEYSFPVCVISPDIEPF